MSLILWNKIRRNTPILDEEIRHTEKNIERKYGSDYLDNHLNKILKAKAVPLDRSKILSSNHEPVDVVTTNREHLYIKANDKFLFWLNEVVPKHFKSYDNFARSCGIKIDAFFIFRKRKRLIFANSLIKILNILSKKTQIPFEMDDIIYDIRWSWKGKPIRIKNHIVDIKSKDCSRLVSAVFHDGCIANDHRLYYINTDSTLRKIVYEAISNWIGDIEIVVREEKRIDFGKTIGEIVLSLFPEIIQYRKSRNYKVPNVFKNGNDEIKIEWLKQSFDDEGSVCGRHIRLKLARDVSYLKSDVRLDILSNPKKHVASAPELLLDNKDMLESLGINVNGPHLQKDSPFIYKDKMGYLRISYQWYIDISHQENLRKFFEIIGFSSEHKRQKLENLVLQDVQPRPKYGKGKEFYLDAMYALQKELGYISSYKLGERINRNEITIKQWIRKFLNEDIIEKTNENERDKYRLCKKGMRMME